MDFDYDKINAQCMWCKRTKNPHPDFLNETIPTKIFTSMSGRKIELCFSCYEYEKNKSNLSDIDFKQNLDLRWEVMKMLKF